MLAALLAGLMSTLTSVFNSASSVVTLDLWTQFRKKASQAELMVVGRVTVVVLIVVSILWLPILQGQQGGILWFYMAAIVAYLGVPWCVAFILALFWNRTSEPVGISVRLFFRFSTHSGHFGKAPDTDGRRLQRQVFFVTNMLYIHVS